MQIKRLFMKTLSSNLSNITLELDLPPLKKIIGIFPWIESALCRMCEFKRLSLPLASPSSIPPALQEEVSFNSEIILFSEVRCTRLAHSCQTNRLGLRSVLADCCGGSRVELTFSMTAVLQWVARISLCRLR